MPPPNHVTQRTKEMRLAQRMLWPRHLAMSAGSLPLKIVLARKRPAKGIAIMNMQSGMYGSVEIIPAA